ncbi:MAG: alpha/beta fold hydrolase [Gammaproteobacteria bacterium]|nr:alpha/beta fold hydrolase [Gammaproteobacteria bacterium]MCP5198674.1 alpha/beta fold hydrolase [Gammaproteobacteria bacterium]
MADHDSFRIAGFTTQSGVTLDVDLAYKTFGTLSAAADNAVLIPTFYGGRHAETEFMLAPGRAIDPARHFVVVVNMLGNGCSTSPSNTPAPYGRGAFPLVTVYDNVCCQHELVTEHLGIKRLRLVSGFSMGAQQTFQWGALHSDMVDAIAPICGAARIADHNHVFVDSAVEALRLDPAFADGWYERAPLRGVLAFGRVYAAWLFSQDFFRERLYEQLGLASREDVVRFTQNYFLANDANDLIAMARTWMNADISANPRFGGDLAAALGAIRCRAIVMPGETDLYFRVADNAAEVAHMPDAELRPIPSKWGHGAGFGIDPADNAFVDAALRELLA